LCLQRCGPSLRRRQQDMEGIRRVAGITRANGSGIANLHSSDCSTQSKPPRFAATAGSRHGRSRF
ncbi:MAG: hypothetical protein ACRD88_19630, partial [Terriglobia bacterium]